jgi:hypothetical protein
MKARFTEAERLERRRAAKAKWDRDNTARKTVNARIRRAKLAEAGLTCRGKPKPNNHAILRAEIAASIPKPAPVNNQRAETIEEFLARGGKIEREPCTLSAPTQYAKFNGTTRLVAGHHASG